jgi:hypothetical protein
VAPGTVVIAAVLLGGCAGGPPAPEPSHAFLLGSFTDDYAERYQISEAEWFQAPHGRLHILRWDDAGQFLIARNDSANANDPGLWTRIDWIELIGMAPYTWAYCSSAFNAPSPAVAETVSVANRATPRTGCNGFPFSRMRRVEER